MSAFVDLIKIAVGRRERFDEALPERKWEKLTKLADKHCIRAALSWGVENLPDEQKPPRKLLLEWVFYVDKVETANRRLEERLAELSGIFADAGFDCCLLKGLGVAQLYPCPSRRQNGDLDLWVNVRKSAADADGGFRRDVHRDIRSRERRNNTACVLDFVRSRWKTGDVVYHHVDVKAFDEVEVEVHFHPSWMNDPFANAKLQRWFDVNRPAAMDLGAAAGTGAFVRCSVPSARFNAVFVLVHALRHLLDEGVGLRQMMDCYYVLMNCSDDDRNAVLPLLKSLRLLRFSSAVMWVMSEVFGLEKERMLCESGEKYGKFLLDEIMHSGNFGRADTRNRHRPGENRLQRLLRKTRRQMRFISIAPHEVIWAPFFKLWQFFWRLSHRGFSAR